MPAYSTRPSAETQQGALQPPAAATAADQQQLLGCSRDSGPCYYSNQPSKAMVKLQHAIEHHPCCWCRYPLPQPLRSPISARANVEQPIRPLGVTVPWLGDHVVGGREAVHIFLNGSQKLGIGFCLQALTTPPRANTKRLAMQELSLIHISQGIVR